MYVIDIEEHWEKVGRAHDEFFANIRPATAMAEVSRLIAPEMLVEIEAEAFVVDDSCDSTSLWQRLSPLGSS